ncbi:hypothetical protein JRO89_XS07G0240100 [Xanthoceras sorbifolium]|uniref:Uncharacterized protein n=1 Tax=Xanthoceras sorbifolium TaxID=99658 RepID=A0ABQ8HV33_9ROSI|nr:hypothetical protein JRO89_XS07G0240100 [Xanthoceras sorbifolium]
MDANPQPPSLTVEAGEVEPHLFANRGGLTSLSLMPSLLVSLFDTLSCFNMHFTCKRIIYYEFCKFKYDMSFNMSLQDPPLSDQQEEEEEEDEETAMPNKRPKLNKYPHSGGLATGEGEGEGYDQFYKSILSSQAKVREANEPQQSTGQVASKWSDYLTQEDKEELRTCQPTMSNDKTQDDMKNPRNSHATMGKAASKWSEYLTEDEPEQRIPRPPKGNGASKWKTLLTQEENDLQDSTGREFVDDHKGEWRNGIFDQEVEDDIHPDFI